jgi:hypothetical protein
VQRRVREADQVDAFRGCLAVPAPVRGSHYLDQLATSVVVSVYRARAEEPRPTKRKVNEQRIVRRDIVRACAQQLLERTMRMTPIP